MSDKLVATRVLRFLQYTEAISASLFGPQCSTLISLIQLCDFLCGSLLVCPQYDACSDENAVNQAAELSNQETCLGHMEGFGEDMKENSGDCRSNVQNQVKGEPSMINKGSSEGNHGNRIPSVCC